MKNFIYWHTRILVLLSIIFIGTLLPKTQAMTDMPIIPTFKQKVVDMKQLICMANNIFYEAGGESMAGQAAVAHVVLNRVRHGFAANPCNVIYQKTIQADKMFCQFTWVCENKKQPNNNNPRYQVAMQVAYEVMILGMHSEVVPRSTLFFHNTGVDPNWPHRKVKQIGNHIFYSKIYNK